MTVKLFSAKRGELSFTEHIPSNIVGMLLPGATCRVATTPDHESLFLTQEFSTAGFVFRYYHFYSMQREPFLLLDKPMTTLRIALSRTHSFHMAQMGKLLFHERHFNLLHIPHFSAEFNIGPRELYTFADVILPPQYLQQFAVSFPVLTSFLDKMEKQLPVKLCLHNQVASIEMLRWIDALQCGEQIPLPDLVYQLLCNSLYVIQDDMTTAAIRNNQADIDKIYQVAEFLQHSREELSIEELSDKFNISTYKLNKLFKQVYGHSVLHHRQEEKMRLALRLIQDQRYNIKQIAQLLDYWPQNFIRAFKNRFGYTPGQHTPGVVRCFPSI